MIGLQCKIWSLFFVLTFLLNFIPEIGAEVKQAWDGRQSTNSKYSTHLNTKLIRKGVSCPVEVEEWLLEGAIASAILTVPAILFDGHLDKAGSRDSEGTKPVVFSRSFKDRRLENLLWRLGWDAVSLVKD